MSEEITYHLISTFAVWSFKLATLLVGYLFAKLGYNLFIKGVTGEFKFKTDIKGAKADLVSASPGLFFILMGTIILGIGLFKGLIIEPVNNIYNGSEIIFQECKRALQEEMPKLLIQRPKLRQTLPESTLSKDNSN